MKRNGWRRVAGMAGLAAWAAWASPACAAGGATTNGVVTAKVAIRKGLDWLASKQKPDGAWSNEDFPALTALALEAFLGSDYPGKAQVVTKAAAFLVACVQPDGGIYKKLPGRGGGLSNYNTAICMEALYAAGRPDLLPIVLKARRFVAAGQHHGDDPFAGGMGYDPGTGRTYADLSDSWIAYEAMRRTQGAEDRRPTGEARTDLDWQAARRFLERCQNGADAGPADAGGFTYRPGESKAGATTNAAGTVVFRAYGSMTYAGLLSLIYSDVTRDDPRVRSAFDWAARHWSLEANPGMGGQGYYYFLNVLAKSLDAYGAETLPTPTGPVAWRPALTARLAALQKADPAGGFWLNENARFWENDPVLVTAYTLVALETATKRIP